MRGSAQPFLDAIPGLKSDSGQSQKGKRALADATAALDGLKLELSRLNAPQELAAAHKDLQSAVDQLIVATRFLQEEYAKRG